MGYGIVLIRYCCVLSYCCLVVLWCDIGVLRYRRILSCNNGLRPIRVYGIRVLCRGYVTVSVYQVIDG